MSVVGLFAGRELRRLLQEALRHRRLVLALAHSNHRQYLGGVQLYMTVQESALADAGISFVNVWPSETAEHLDVSADGRHLGSFVAGEVEEALRQRAADVVSVDVHHLRGWTVAAAGRILSSLSTP